MFGLLLAVTLCNSNKAVKRKEIAQNLEININALSTENVDSEFCYEAYKDLVDNYKPSGSSTAGPSNTPTGAPTSPSTGTGTATSAAPATSPVTATSAAPATSPASATAAESASTGVKRKFNRNQKKNINHMRKKDLITDIVLLGLFESECKATVNEAECKTLVDNLKTSAATDADKASFATKCKVEDPSSGGNNEGSGFFTAKTSKFLLLLTLAMAKLYFKA
jgi:hypothetical protein